MDIPLPLWDIKTNQASGKSVEAEKIMGLAIESIKKLLSRESVSVTGKLHSAERSRDFDLQDVKLQIFKESKESDKLKLALNGQNIIDWFKKKYQEIKQTKRSHLNPPIKT